MTNAPTTITLTAGEMSTLILALSSEWHNCQANAWPTLAAEAMSLQDKLRRARRNAEVTA
jgi:hypothetical protein